MADYPIPTWLQGQPAPNPAAAYIQSFQQARQQAVQVQLEQERLAQSMAQANMAAAARQQALAQQSALRQQEIQVQKARIDSLAGLQRQRLDTAAEALNLRAQDAARKFAATQAFASEVGDGSDPARVTRAVLKYGAVLGQPGAMAAAVRTATAPAAMVPGAVQGQQVLDPLTKAPIPGAVAVPSSGGRGYQYHWAREDSGDLTKKQRIDLLERKRSGLLKGHDSVQKKMDPTAWQATEDELDAIDAKEQQLAPELGEENVPQATKSKVRVKAPDGRTGSVPADRLQEYIDAGYKKL